MPMEPNEISELPEKRAGRDIRSFMDVVPRLESTYVVVVAKHRSKQNPVRHISGKHGIPIGGYVFDSQNDCYLVKCLSSFDLGLIPISFKIEIKGVGPWCIDVPIPEAILKRYWTIPQRAELKKFQAEYSEDCDFEFIQFLGLN